MVRVKLGSVAKERKSSKTDNKNTNHSVGLEHLIPEEIVLTQYNENADNTFTKAFCAGDILFGRRRAYLKKAALAQFDGICSGDITVIEPLKDQICPDLLPFIIQNDRFFEYAVIKSAGSLSPRVKWEQLKEFEFELPDMEQQAKLTKVLWAAERTKQAYKSLIAKIDDMIEAKFIEMFGDPISNSKKFPTKKMIDIAPSKSYDGNIEPIDGKYWLLNLDMVESNSGNLINKVWVAPKEIGTSTTKFSPRHVLYSKLRPYLNKVYIPDDYGYTTTEMLPLLPDTNIILKEFLAALLRCKPVLNMLKNNVSGTRMPRTNLSVFWNLNVITPPLELQQKFVAIIEQAEQTKKDTQVALDNLNALIKSLINENLTTGEQDV